MKILGLIGFGYNPGAALVVDGRLVAHCEEERLTRLKGSHHMFPGRSAAWCLERGGLSLEDVDQIAWAWDQDAYRFRVPAFFVRSFFKQLGSASGGNVLTVAEYLLENNPKGVRQKILEGLRMVGLTGRVPPIEFLPHHKCHAASTYYMSGFDDSNVVILDGSGETYTSSIFHGRGNDLRDVEHVEIPNSLGWMFAAITEYLGFIPYRDEGKVMGLAAYGERKDEYFEKIGKIVQVGHDSFQVDPRYCLLGPHNQGKHYSDHMIELFGEPRRYNQPLAGHEQDIAFAAQTVLEQAAQAMVRRANARNPSRNLCVAGGVALNCKMNGVLRTMEGIDGFFVQPSSSDAGSALGAAVLASAEAGEWRNEQLSNVYYGPEFTDDQIVAALDNAGVPYSTTGELHDRVAQAVSDDKVVSIYRGPMEFGARALGHRSIVANPVNPEMKDIVNARVKFREQWRPFCPSMTREAAGRYFEPDGELAPFMVVAYWMREEMRAKLPSVVHCDGSIRPQTVEREVEPFWWECIEAVGKLTGEPIVMNTSFNVRGQPIVNSPQDALACFYSTGLDAMAIGSYWVEKPGQPG
jgi:carbamoyltransferase